MIMACEQLATKAELQQLRDEINQLLGRPKGLTGTPINVLAQGNLNGTHVGSKMVSDIHLVKDEENPEIVKMAFNSGDTEIGIDIKEGITSAMGLIQNSINNSTKLLTTAYALVKSENLRNNVMEEIGKSLADFLDNNRVAKAVEEAIRKDMELGRALGYIESLDKAGGNIQAAKDNSVVYKQNMENAKQSIESLKEGVLAQQQQINNLQDNDYFQDQIIQQQVAELQALANEINESDLYTQQVKNDLQLQINYLLYRASKEEEDKDKLKTVAQSLGEQLAKTQGDLVEVADRYNSLVEEQVKIKERFEELEQELEEIALEEGILPYVPFITSPYIVKTSYRSTGGGGVPVNVGKTITFQQQAILDTAKSLAGNPGTVTTPEGDTLTTAPDINWQKILQGNQEVEDIYKELEKKFPYFGDLNDKQNQNAEDIENLQQNDQAFDLFVQNLNQQFQDFLTNNPQGEPQVTPEQLNDWGTNFREQLKEDWEFISTGVIVGALAPPLNDIKSQTTPAAITSASSEAICQQANSPDSCLNTKIGNPLKNSVQGIKDGLGIGLDTANILYSQSILGRLIELRNFVGKAWQNVFMDKILNTVGTVLAFHNAMMLSRNLGVTIGETATLFLEAINVKDHAGEDIDVNAWMSAKFTALMQKLLTVEGYAAIVKAINAANRIITAGQGMASAIHGLKDSIQEGQEIIANRVGKIGNAFLEQGILETGSYDWMDDDLNLKTPFKGFTQYVQNLTEFVEEVNELIETGIEVNENFNELFESAEEAITASQQLENAIQAYIVNRELSEQEKDLESASPEIANSDLIRGEAEDSNV